MLFYFVLLYLFAPQFLVAFVDKFIIITAMKSVNEHFQIARAPRETYERR
jgi:hypothetical protein